MGTIHHNAVLATTCGDERRNAVLAYIGSLEEFDRAYFHVGPEFTNGYFTVVLMPDGSKEGWEGSEHGDRRRESFVAWLVANGWFSCIEVGYGELSTTIREVGSSEDDE